MGDNDIFARARLLYGDDALGRLRSLSVILFGAGGVGSWCAESLIRSGVCSLTIVDSDSINPSNINRQLPATIHTIGRPKVEAMKERLLSINPEAEITAIQMRYCRQTASEFDLGRYDYVIDAIDSLQDKQLLLFNAAATDATILSSMGAALKVEPANVKVAGFWDVTMDPLARALRKKMRRENTIPAKDFRCVYSDEVPQKRLHEALGSSVHITGIFGLTLAGEIIKDMLREEDND